MNLLPRKDMFQLFFVLFFSSSERNILSERCFPKIARSPLVNKNFRPQEHPRRVLRLQLILCPLLVRVRLLRLWLTFN